MKKILFYIIVLYTLQCKSQSFSNQYFGTNIGLILNLGTHVQSIGFNFKNYYHDQFYQINIGSSITFNINSYGNRKNLWESRTYFGLILLGGKKNNSIDFMMDGLTHQTRFQNSVGYNYVWYYDNRQTSQRSGGWSIGFKNFNILFENDIFGGQGKDRFRSGHILFSYFNENIRFGTGFYIWTGETKGATWIKTPMDGCPYGYSSLENNPYGKTSHGILYATIQGNLPFNQTFGGKIGIDSEHLRHKIQNRLIHDLVFLPKKFPRKTPHYPRLDENGLPVFSMDSVRKSKFYFQSFVNEFN